MLSSRNKIFHVALYENIVVTTRAKSRKALTPHAGKLGSDQTQSRTSNNPVLCIHLTLFNKCNLHVLFS